MPTAAWARFMISRDFGTAKVSLRKSARGWFPIASCRGWSVRVDALCIVLGGAVGGFPKGGGVSFLPCAFAYEEQCLLCWFCCVMICRVFCWYEWVNVWCSCNHYCCCRSRYCAWPWCTCTKSCQSCPLTKHLCMSMYCLAMSYCQRVSVFARRYVHCVLLCVTTHGCCSRCSQTRMRS